MSQRHADGQASGKPLIDNALASGETGYVSRLALSERLLCWAHNEEMIDQFFTAHGRDCVEAARILNAIGDRKGA